MLWQNMTGTASVLIRKYGSPIDLIQNPPDPEYEAGTNRPYWVVDGVKTYTAPSAKRYAGFGAPRDVNTSEIVDGRIRITDTAFSVVDTPEPTTKDKIEWLDIVYNIVHVIPKYLQSHVIVYIVYARQA